MLPFGAQLLVVLKVALIVALAFIAYVAMRQAARLAVTKLLDREAEAGTSADLAAAELEKRARTLEMLAVRSGGVLIVVVAVLMILHEFAIDIGPAIAGLGIAGLAIGLGTQTLVRDWVAGILILLENQYSRGDIVEIAGVTGTVEHISLRRTVLRGEDGTVHSVPNGEIRVASNQTKFWSGIALDIQVPSMDAVPAATAAIQRIGEELKTDPAWAPLIVEPPRVDRISSVADGKVTLRVLGSVRTKAQWKVAGELRRRVATELGPDGVTA